MTPFTKHDGLKVLGSGWSNTPQPPIAGEVIVEGIAADHRISKIDTKTGSIASKTSEELAAEQVTAEPALDPLEVFREVLKAKGLVSDTDLTAARDRLKKPKV